jgi:hypothetical protein
MQSLLKNALAILFIGLCCYGSCTKQPMGIYNDLFLEASIRVYPIKDTIDLGDTKWLVKMCSV